MAKILIATNHSYMLYRFRKDLVKNLMKNHEVVLSMPYVGHEDDWKALGCTCIETDVDRRGVNPKTDWKLLRTYAKLVKQEKPDLVITYSIKPNIYLGMVCKARGIPYCANVQGLGTAFEWKKLAWFVTKLYRMALKKARTVFFENQANADIFCQRNIIPAEKITVLPGAGVDLEQYALTPYPQEETKNFLYLGRIMQEKGMDEWFDAVQRLKKEYGDQVAFHMVGFFEDSYKEIVERLEQEGVIKFHGFQENPLPFYAMSHCVVIPSYHEGLSNVLLEAEAMGRPVVTTDIPGCRETVEDGKTGFLCKAKDSESLYQAMKLAIESSNEELEEMGKQARSYVSTHFEKKRVVAKTIKALKI